MKIHNFAPEARIVLDMLEPGMGDNYKITITMEDGKVYIVVEDEDGSETRLVLGQDGMTTRI